MRFNGLTVCGVSAAFILAAAALAEPVQLTPLPTGAMKKMGGYRPQKVTLSSEKPASVKKAPEGLGAPLYGVLPIGPAADGKPAPGFLLIVDEPAGKDARLFVDTNGNGDLTDDPATEWQGKPSKDREGHEWTMYMGGATVRLGSGDTALPAHLGMYRFDKNDPSRAALKDSLLYYSDYAYEGDIKLGDAAYKMMLTDDMTRGDFRGQPGPDGSGISLLIDVNANGKFDSRGERYDVTQPFNIKGTTYEITGLNTSGRQFQVGKSSKTVAEILPPPDLSVGKMAIAFDAKTTDGKAVSFPASFKGKLVMLDFWATWCQPCMGEVPGLAAAYEKFHPKGFEILGISLDQEKAEDKLASVTRENKMTWAQVYDGKYWKAAIADLYVVNSIPRAFLVDGDTGEIVAGGDDLRGEKLVPTLEKALEKKKGGS